MPRVRGPLEPLLAASQKALKEWAVVCAALESGRQSVLLRKGGIVEETRDFALVESRFLLFPTYEHQDAAHVRTTLDGPPQQTGRVRISAWAEVDALYLCPELDVILELGDLWIWTEEYVRKRMAYKPRKPMNVVVLRVHALPSPVWIAEEEHFAGCKSWVPLQDALPTESSRPILDDAAHDAVLTRADAVLQRWRSITVA